MPLFFLNIYNGGGFAEDDEGSDCADLAAARACALKGIRSLLAEEVTNGRLNLNGQIEIVDEASQVLEVVPFRDAVEIVPDHGPS